MRAADALSAEIASIHAAAPDKGGSANHGQVLEASRRGNPKEAGTTLLMYPCMYLNLVGARADPHLIPYGIPTCQFFRLLGTLGIETGSHNRVNE